MTTDQLSFREAFEAWMKGREGYPFARQFADLMWKAWQGAMESRPTAVASHAEGEVVARRFHEAYERLAPSFGYETRQETREFDPTSPNGRLMIAVCNEVMSNPPRSGDEAGHVVVTRDSTGEIIAVTLQDDDGRILSVIDEKFTDEQRRKFTAEYALTQMSVQAAMAARGCSDE